MEHESRSDAATQRLSENEIVTAILDEAFYIHRELGPGLLESVYESVLASLLEKRDMRVERQKPIGFEFAGIAFQEGLKLDLLVEGKVIVELKSVEKLSSVHAKQLKTYLVLSQKKLGLLINFGEAYLKDGIKRVANGL